VIPIYSICHRLRQFRQGVTKRDLKPADKQPFFITLRRITEHRGILPARVRVTETIEVSDEILDYGGFADVRSGTYKGHAVAVKTMRIMTQDDFVKKRKVSINIGCQGHGLSCPTPAVLQWSHHLEHAIPPERLGARRSSGGHERTAARHRVTMDGPWEHHEVHQ